MSNKLLAPIIISLITVSKIFNNKTSSNFIRLIKLKLEN